MGHQYADRSLRNSLNRSFIGSAGLARGRQTHVACIRCDTQATRRRIIWALDDRIDGGFAILTGLIRGRDTYQAGFRHDAAADDRRLVELSTYRAQIAEHDDEQHRQRRACDES